MHENSLSRLIGERRPYAHRAIRCPCWRMRQAFRRASRLITNYGERPTLKRPSLAVREWKTIYFAQNQISYKTQKKESGKHVRRTPSSPFQDRLANRAFVNAHDSIQELQRLWFLALERVAAND